VNPRESWEAELESAFLYRVLGEVEPVEERRKLFTQLALEAAAQSEIWRAQARDAGAPLPDEWQPRTRVRLVAWLLRRLGPRNVLPVLAAMKVRGLSVYSGQPAEHALPTRVEEVGGRHRSASSGNLLRAAVFGVNDGLVSNASLILGVAGATSQSDVIVLTGTAGLLAGALSMAAGEYISVRSQREMFEAQIEAEREELATYPDAEAEELALIYTARGLERDEAKRLAARLIAEPARALDTLAREELGLDPDSLGSPLGAAGFSLLSFALGGIVPLAPFLLTRGPQALMVAIALTGVSLFAIGALLSLFSGRSALYGGLRMLAIGGVAGLATFAIGHWLGVSAAG
jgi:VIT1/CCC1 family predicted Fe2+/Mn2+ transporter